MLVYTVFTLEILQTVLTSRDIFVALGTSIGNSDLLNVVDLVYHHWFSIPVSGGISEYRIVQFYFNLAVTDLNVDDLAGAIGQSFFAYRLWVISQTNMTTGQIASESKHYGYGTPAIIGTVSAGQCERNASLKTIVPSLCSVSWH